MVESACSLKCERAFNQEKALVGPFSMIVKSSRRFVWISTIYWHWDISGQKRRVVGAGREQPHEAAARTGATQEHYRQDRLLRAHCMELTVTNRRSAQFLIHFQETKDDELQGLLATTSHLDLTAPMPGCAVGQRRHLLLEGDLKMREGSSSKVVNIFVLSTKYFYLSNIF